MGSHGTGVGPATVQALLMGTLLVLASATLDIREPPSIKQPSVAQDLFFRVGAKVRLECKATGTPDPVYEWYWNEVQVTSSSGDGIAFDGVTGTLVINELDEKKEGFFNCRARNTFPGGISAIAISPKIQVRVARVGAWNVDPGVTLFTGTEGSYMHLPCDSNMPKYYGPIDFKWYMVQGGTQSEHILDDRQFIDNKGTLHFTYLTMSDQTEEGRYYACALSNAISGNIQAGSKKKLTVTKNNDIQNIGPVLQHASHAVAFRLNREAKLECFFSGFSRKDGMPEPYPSITWTDGGAKIITTDVRFKIEEEGRLLKIRDLRESDEGHYNCKGMNSEGTATGTVMLNVTSAPIWTERLQAKIVSQGQDATFTCQTRSASGENPPDPPKWYRNAVRLDLAYDSNKYVFSSEKRVLTVKAAQKSSDIACFQCSVSNSEGEVFGDGCLNVILPITIVSQPAEHQVIEEGDVVDLTVVATSDPLVPLSYRWIFENETFEDPDAPPRVTFDPVSHTAYINTSGFTEEEMEAIAGVYSRKVYHTYQVFVINVKVTLKDAPIVIVPVAEAGFDYWIIGLIIGILLIIIVIIIICCVICRRKMLEGDYPVDRKETAAGLDPEKELKDSGFHDLSRADYDFPSEKKSPNMDFEDQIPLGDDESFGSAEYGEEATAFNEDGSFIGQYSKGKKAGGPPAYNAESNV